MVLAKFPKGSEWRKWDLHVHSPASHKFKGTWEDFIFQLAGSECELIGINDYFSVDGYKHLKALINEVDSLPSTRSDLKNALSQLKSKALLPVVECRMTNVLQNKNSKSGVRLNFHIIFSNKVNVDNIETFIKQLHIYDRMIGDKYDDPEFLLNSTSVDFLSTVQQLKNERAFKDKYYKNQFLIWLPYDEYGGIDDVDPQADRYLKEGFINISDLIGSANANQINFFLGKNEKFPKEKIEEWFGKPKPCVKGTDSHDASSELGRLKDDKNRPTDKYFWVKADPTFEGLCQIVNEPEDRVFIGKRPPKLKKVENNKTFHISQVKIRKKDNSNLEEKWFDCELDLNHGLVAIIGNKGKGKSALTDIIALAGNTKKAEHFSFLTKDRFRIKGGRLAQNFETSVIWADGEESAPIGLHENPSSDALESVVYIPQSYLEEVCTERDASEKSKFQKEIRHVIFSHIDQAKRLGNDSLENLITYETEEKIDQIKIFKDRLSKINQEIISLEEQLKPGHLKQIEEALKEKKRQLEVHAATRPDEQPNPESLDKKTQQRSRSIQDELSRKNSALAKLEQAVSEARINQQQVYKRKAELDKLKSKLSSIKGVVEVFIRENSEVAIKLELDIKEIVTFGIDANSIEKLEGTLQKEIQAIDTSLSEEAEESLINQSNALKKEIGKLESELDEPQKKYQEYLRTQDLWDKAKNVIEGDEETPDTIKYHEKQIAYIEDELEADLYKLESDRELMARSIYGYISEIRDVYTRLFSSVQELIENNNIIKDEFKLSFGASIAESDLSNGFLETYINQGVSGSFCGKQEGEKKLESLIAKYDLDVADEAIELVKDLIEHLRIDKRNNAGLKVSTSGQLKKGKTLQALYDYLWSLDYLKPEYFLKLDDKHLNQLSPGERGSLLLVFYLLIDKSKKPIIIDQPEENLDNFTVYNLLFPVIREVKKHRQIIMVTHSPNIAVVCDAEQVIHAEFDRLDGNKITYTSGSIEDSVINQHIVDVLEGTRPAFRKRDAKYQS